MLDPSGRRRRNRRRRLVPPGRLASSLTGDNQLAQHNDPSVEQPTRPSSAPPLPAQAPEHPSYAFDVSLQEDSVIPPINDNDPARSAPPTRNIEHRDDDRSQLVDLPVTSVVAGESQLPDVPDRRVQDDQVHPGCGPEDWLNDWFSINGSLAYSSDIDRSDALEEGFDFIDKTSLNPAPSNIQHKAISVLQSVKKKMTSAILIAILTLYGKVRYTIQAYDHMVAVLKPYTHLPSSSTMRQRCLPYLLDHILVKSQRIQCVRKSGQSGFVCKSTGADSCSTMTKKNKGDEAVVVLPSSWARMDLRCIHILRQIACLTSCRCNTRTTTSNDIRIEESAIVTAKKRTSTRPCSLWVNDNGVPIQAPLHSILTLHTFVEYQLPAALSDSIQTDFRRVKHRGEDSHAFNCVLLSTYTVQHSEADGSYLALGQEKSTQRVSNSFLTHCLSCLNNLCDQDQSSEQRSKSNQDSISAATSDTSSKDNSSGDNLPDQISPEAGRASDADEDILPTKRRKISVRTHCRANSPAPSENQQASLRCGDLVSVLCFDLNTAETVLIAHVSRFWVDRLDDDRQVIIVFYKNSDQNGPAIKYSTLPSFGIPSLVQAADTCNDSTSTQCKTMGTLESGERYYMYRVLLYADDFNPRSQLFPRGSVGGVYMFPSSLPMRSRRSQSSIRTISLTPPGVSTNFVLNSLVADLVEGSLNGFSSVDAFGTHCICFFDILGFVADYPASSAAVDVKGHTALAPCTHCGFQYSPSIYTSKYAYSTSITSSNSAFMRTQTRTSAVRAAGIDKKQAKSFGLKYIEFNDRESTSHAPLLNYATEFNKRVQQSGAEVRMTQPEVDGYNLNIIAPDHLFTGLIKGLLLATFRHIESDRERDNLQTILSAALLDYGFQFQSLLYKDKKLVPGLTMSMLYAIFTALPASLKSLNIFASLPTSRMITHLHSLICLSFWWPNFSTDGSKAFAFVHGTGMSTYHRSLSIMSKNFVKSVDKYVKAHPEYRSLVDRPNTHRLLELTTHTIPLYSHVLFVTELVFESSHQPLKYFLSRNHLSNSHIYSVNLVLVRDWLIRLAALWSIHSSSTESGDMRNAAMFGLMRLMCGDIFDDVNWDNCLVDSQRQDIKAHILSVFDETVEERLQTWYSDTFLQYETASEWSINMKTLIEVKGTSPRMCSISSAVRTLSTLFSIPIDQILVYEAALLHRGYGSNTVSTHERIRSGDVVQVLTRVIAGSSSRFVPTGTDGSGRHKYLVVGFVLKCGIHGLWAAVKECSTFASQTAQLLDYNKELVITATTSPFFTDSTAKPISFVKLDKNVKRVGVQHNCSATQGCKFDTSARTVSHSQTTLTGGSFFLQTRALGYPPRRS